MVNSTKRRKPTLWLHKSTGRWTKKVNGKFWHFGSAKDDPTGEKAEAQWHLEKKDILAGRNPRVVVEEPDPNALTIAELCDRFVQFKDGQLAAGEITQRTRNDYKQTADRIVGTFSKQQLVARLTPADFRRLKASIKGGVVTRANEIGRIRVVFNFGWDERLLDKPVHFGKTFKKPTKKELRLARAERGSKMVQAADLRRIIDAADVHLRAMGYLGLNCAFGNNDVGTLPLKAVDLKTGWVRYHRTKTGIPRRAKLWPETIAALKESLASRPKPKTTEAQAKFFITRCGDAWAKTNTQNPVSGEFLKLLKKLELHRPGVGFYSLRHVFRTIAGGAGDLEATRLVMGHTGEHVENDYIEDDGISEDRLQRVVDHVRAWLLKDAEPKQPAKQPAKRPSKRHALRLVE